MWIHALGICLRQAIVTETIAATLAPPPTDRRPAASSPPPAATASDDDGWQPHHQRNHPRLRQPHQQQCSTLAAADVKSADSPTNAEGRRWAPRFNGDGHSGNSSSSGSGSQHSHQQQQQRVDAERLTSLLAVIDGMCEPKAAERASLMALLNVSV